AATARGIPVTNIPDTFIEEVADHAMMLLLAGFRRLIEQDKMVRSGRWAEGRPALLKSPRLMGQTLGFISFGRVARAAPDGYTFDIGQWDTHVGSIIYKLDYDLEKDFEPIALISNNPQLMVAKNDLPANTLGELVTW
ncbi:tripartite tricarboxylate transporter substrate-binding protein, partial [Salmonella enterica]|uniref:tripartite tricarboxylate transporter substrate-binding protein n=1 Tax=Salmonella enterica TaxID=28901 RepID=UPI0032B4B82D